MEKMKIYLDTNTVIDFFINQAVALRKGGEANVPKKLEFFLEIRDRVEFLTSFLTKTEVMRELVAGQGIDKEKVEEFWNDFINLLKCYYVKEFSFDEEIVNIAGSLKLKLRTLVNFFHLFVARSRNAYFVTGDKDMVEKARKAKIYDKIVTYIELRQLISSFS